MNFDLSPQIAERLNVAAHIRRIAPTKLLENLVEDSLPAVESSPATGVAPTISAKNAAAIDYLDRRMKEEATDDPDEIRQADEEVAELKRNLNANRAATGERLVSR